jgi:hypothetical protein
MKFVRDMKSGVGTPMKLQSMVMMTCEIYDALCHKQKQVRWPMKVTDPLPSLAQYVQTEIYPWRNARLLIDVNGIVNPINYSQPVDPDVVLRFDVVPPDQKVPRPWEQPLISK